MRICPACGKELQRRPAEKKHKFDSRRTCSRSCGAKWRQQKEVPLGEYVGSEISRLMLSPPARYKKALTKDLTAIAAAELRDVQASVEIAKRQRRPLSQLLAAQRRLLKVVEMSPWRSAVEDCA